MTPERLLRFTLISTLRQDDTITSTSGISTTSTAIMSRSARAVLRSRLGLRRWDATANRELT